MNTEKHNIQLLWKFCTQYMQNYLNRDSKLNTINVENRYFNNIFSCSQCGLKNVIIEIDENNNLYLDVYQKNIIFYQWENIQ